MKKLVFIFLAVAAVACSNISSNKNVENTDSVLVDSITTVADSTIVLDSIVVDSIATNDSI